MKTQPCTAAVDLLLTYSTKMDKLRLRELECRCAYVQGELLDRQLKRIREEQTALTVDLSFALEQPFIDIVSMGQKKAAQLPMQDGASMITILNEKIMSTAFILDRVLAMPDMPAIAMGVGYMEVFKDLDDYLIQLEQA